MKDCFIKDLSNGCIVLTSNDKSTKLLAESSVFVKTSYSKRGGAISTITGQCVQSRICATNCKCVDYGHFSAAYTYYEKGYKNFLNESSVVECSNNGGSGSPICNHYGDNLMNMINLTNCNCHIPGYVNEATQYFTGIVSFSQFSDNISPDYTIACEQYNQRFTHHCNFVSNKCKYVFASEGSCNLKVEDCVIKNNDIQSYIFSNSMITVIQCYCSNVNNAYGSATTAEISTEPFENFLRFLSTANCQAVEPIIDKDDENILSQIQRAVAANSLIEIFISINAM